MKLLFFVCARAYMVDQPDNAVSVYDIVEHIHCREFPTSPSELHLVAMVKRSSAEPHADLTLTITLNGRKIMKTPFRVMFGDGDTARCFGRFGDLLLPAPGKLTFTLDHAGQPLGEWTTAVHQVAEAGEAKSGRDALPEISMLADFENTGYVH